MINDPTKDCGCGCGGTADAHIPTVGQPTQGWKVQRVCVSQFTLPDAPEQPFIALRGLPLDGEWGDIPWTIMTVTSAEEVSEMLRSQAADVRTQGWTGL